MDKKEFPGSLSGVSPRLIIGQDSSSDIENFFLILGMIYNDLKGILFFQTFIKEEYRKPVQLDEVSPHVGEYGGLLTHGNKLLISTVAEFFIFLDKNKNVINSPRFALILKALDAKSKSDWKTLVSDNKDSKLLSNIDRIRNNISFHYDHSKRELRKGFINSFFSKSDDRPQHRKAYFSLGGDMESTRFYFADAAVDEYMKSLVNSDELQNIFEVVDKMNRTIQALMLSYLKMIMK